MSQTSSPNIIDEFGRRNDQDTMAVTDMNEDEVLRALGSSPQLAEVEHLLFPDLEGVGSPQPTDSSCDSSPFSSPYQQENSRDRFFVISLLHKPRGSQGVWQEVSNGEGLRVTKGKGKRLKLQIKANFDMDKNNVDISMVDLIMANPVASKDGFTMEGTFQSDDPRVAEFEIKLIKYCKKLQFQVVIQTPLGPLQGRSIAFGSHNNGKANKSPENVPSPPGLFGDKKRKLGSGEDAQDVHLIEGNLEVNGFVKARAFMQFSDIRLKTDIADLTDALNIISNLQGKTYCWKNDGTVLTTIGGQRVIGLIAQEVQRVLPEVK